MFSSLDDPSSPFFPFPWPFLDAVDDGLFSAHVTAPATIAPAGVPNAPAEAAKKRKRTMKMKMKIPSKRTAGKKDRHSKICTAQGLRDRRMRLSLKVARRFFDLQDMLGFDKASKTIEWLLLNSKDAIHQLTRQVEAFKDDSRAYKTIESAYQRRVSSEESEGESEAKNIESKQPGGESCKKRRKSSDVEIEKQVNARESRDKARARARERTKEKLMMRSQTQSRESKTQMPKTQDSSQEINSCNIFEEVGVMEELIMGITRSSSSSTFSYSSPDFGATSSHNNGFPGFVSVWNGMEEPRIEPAPGCYAITTKKPSLDSNPSSSFSPAQHFPHYWIFP